MPDNQRQSDVHPLLNQKRRKHNDIVLQAPAVPKAKAYQYLHEDHDSHEDHESTAALDAWKVLGQHADLSVQQQELCLGPDLSVHVFDHATIGNARLACTRVEKSKFALDSVVLTKSNGKYWAGRVNAFLSHAPPGWEDCHLSEEANVAEVDWFADAVPAAGISDGLSVCLGCPVFKRDFQDDRTGNLWPMERLTPCKLASLPHSSHSDNLVVLSHFASFMHQVPEVS